MAIFSTFVATVASAGFFTALTTTFVGQMLVSLAFSALSRALAGKDEVKQKKSGIVGTIQQGADTPRSFILGKYATAGSLVYHNTWGNDGDTPNAYYTRVTAVSDMPVKEMIGVWIDGKYAEIDFANPDPGGKGFPIVGYTQEQQVDRVVAGGLVGNIKAVVESVLEKNVYAWVKFYDGNQTTSDPFLVNTVSSGARPWSPDNVGYGVAYAITTFRFKRDLYRGFPSVRFVLDGMRQYDPDTDSLGTGDDLPVVQARTILHGISYNGDWLYGPQGAGAGRTDDTEWAEEVAKCKQPPPGASNMTDSALFRAFMAFAGNFFGQGGGTMTASEVPERYRSGLEVDVSRNIAEVLEDLVSACNGRITDTGYRYRFQVGDPPVSGVAVINDGEILSTEGQTFSPFFPLSDTVNAVTAVYPEPTEAWEVQDAPPLYVDEYEAEDGNRRLPTTVSLNAVPYREQVQRIMAAALKEARRARRHNITLPHKYWALEVGDYIEWNSERNGYDNKMFRIDGLTDLVNGDINIDITETDHTDYSWDASVDYVDVTPGYLGPDDIPAVAGTGWQVTAIGIPNNSGSGKRPGILLNWDPNQEDVQAITWRVQQGATNELVSSGAIGDVQAGGVVISSGILPDTTYRVQGRYISESGRNTSWSPWMEITTGAYYITESDLDATLSQKITDAQQDAATASQEANDALQKALNVENTSQSAYVLRPVGGVGAAFIKLVEWEDEDGSVSGTIVMNGDNVIAPGTLSTDRLVVGLGRNQIRNSRFQAGLSGFGKIGYGLANSATTLTLRGPGNWAGYNYQTAELVQNNGEDDGASGIVVKKVNKDGSLDNLVFEVTPGAYYELSGQISMHRAEGALVLYWYRADGTEATNDFGNGVTHWNLVAYGDPGSQDMTNPEKWKRQWTGPVQAPSDAAFCWPEFRKYGTTPGNSNSYMFLHKPQFTDSHAGATQPSPYSPDGSTMIDGGMLTTNAVTADNIYVDELSAISARIGFFQSAASGARMEIRDDRLVVYDSAGRVRVKLGNLS